MQRPIPALVFAAVAALAAGAAAQDQERQRPLVFRDFAAVQRLRVVCEQKHFGRVEDFVTELPGGRVVAVVVAMTVADGTRRVAVPYEEVAFDTTANQLLLGPCREGDPPHPSFDPTKIGVTPRANDDGSPGGLEGTVLLSGLARTKVGLDDGTAQVQGVTLELTSGHVAFLEVAAVDRRAGDAELRPVPWGAFAFAAEGGADAPRQLAVKLARSKAALAAAPSLLDVIVEDPLYRGKLYAFHKTPPPAYERDR